MQFHAHIDAKGRPQLRGAGLGQRRILRRGRLEQHRHLVPPRYALDFTEILARQRRKPLRQDRADAGRIDVDAAQFHHVVGAAEEAFQPAEIQADRRCPGDDFRNIVSVEADDRENVILEVLMLSLVGLINFLI